MRVGGPQPVAGAMRARPRAQRPFPGGRQCEAFSFAPRCLGVSAAAQAAFLDTERFSPVPRDGMCEVITAVMSPSLHQV